MKDRIKALRKALNKKQSEFASDLHLATNYISLIESGKNAVSDKFIYNVVQTYKKVNEDWLRTGEGEMFKALDYEQEVAEIVWDIINRNYLTDEELEQYIELIRIISKVKSEDIEMLLQLAKRFENN